MWLLPLSALLANSTRKRSCYLTPILRTILSHHGDQYPIFFISPRSLDHCWIEYFLPSVKALDISPVVEERSYSLPIFGSICINKFPEFFILEINWLCTSSRGYIIYLFFCPIPLDDIPIRFGIIDYCGEIFMNKGRISMLHFVISLERRS